MDALVPIKTGISILFYSSITAFIIFLILLVVNSYVTPILPFVSSNIPSTITTSSVNTQSLYTTNVTPSDDRMIFNTITTFNYNKFAVSFDCYVKNTYLSTDVPRVVLYFANSPATITNNTDLVEYRGDDKMPNILTISQTDIINKFNNTNFIIYVDPVKNDLKVGLITIDSGIMYLELIPVITNIPINNPFKITLNITQKFVEVYKDLTLKYTYTPKYTLNPIVGTPYLYGPISFIKDTVQIANIQYFDNIITSSQVRTLTNATKSASFFK